MSLPISRQVCLWYLLALVVVLLDQASKLWASSHIAYGASLEITAFFNFTLLHNPGAAFSFLSDAGGWQRWFFTALATVVSLLLIVWIAKVAARSTRETFALVFILGGALGNLYDRIAYGYVIDFIVVHYRDYVWPAFNLADSAITLGAFILIAEMFLTREKKSHA
ncbi:MAG TPA: signal peptidase II [Cellvibrio sp.]|nr:signal peptidase II [Cellvibrio sp.]